MKVLIVGDIHLSDRPPSIRYETYAAEILAKLWQTVTLAKDREVDAVVWAGDVFHIKTPSRTSHALVMETMEIAKSYPCRLGVVPGNHDMSHDRLDSLDAQPLGVLFRADVATMLIGVPWPEIPVFGIPYLQNWDDLPLWLADYRKSEMFSTDEGGLVITHAPIMPPGQTQPYETIDADKWADLQGHGWCYYGHIHDWHGEFPSSDGAVQFCNQGALSRGSLHESSLSRRPAVTLWDWKDQNGTGFERIEIEHKPAAEVFRLAQHEEEVQRVERLDEFLSRISGTTLDHLSVESVLSHVATLGLSPKTERAVRECLEEVVSR